MKIATAAASLLCLAVGLSSASAQAPAAAAGSAEPAPKTLQEIYDRLDLRYQQWIASVRGLMTQPELEYFLALREDFRRDAFLEAFWEPRDPDPTTARNELRERWEEYKDNAGGLPYGDPRFVLYLLNGPPGGFSLPDGRPMSRCYDRSRELEIWFYGGSEIVDRDFLVIFYRPGSEAPYEAYHPGESVRPIQRTGGLPTTDIQLLCQDDVLRYSFWEVSRITGYDRLLKRALSPPLPPPEWLATVAARGTDLPAAAETFEVSTDIRFPARNQSRSAMQVMLGVPRDQAPGQRFDDQLFHNFRLVGEVLRDGRLFEEFEYSFEGPTPEGSTVLPIGFTRYLRPGPAQMRLLIEDVFGRRYAQVIREIDVPRPDGLPSIPRSQLAARTAEGPVLRLVPPSGTALSGLVRFQAYSKGGELEKVAFFLDDRQILSKRRPPYSVEIDLGESPAPHRVRVVGYAGDREVATDQVWLNQGAQRFRTHLVEPRQGGIYPGGVTARIEVHTPDGLPPERVELFLDDERVATLTEPPYRRSLRLSGREAAVVRAVAYLADGMASEDAVVINAAFTETVEVRLVELSVLVTGADGRPVPGLDQETFRVLEDGVRQQIRLFEATGEAPVHAALLLDRSISMKPHLGEVTAAARAFSAAALRSAEDRLAIFSFAEGTTVNADFTSETAEIDRALAGLAAGGRTALYDSLVESLHTFEGIAGQTALLLFTDGRDEISRQTFDDVLGVARRAGVTVYVVGLAAAFPDRVSRNTLRELAAETGGEAHFLAALDQLGGIYASILDELRSSYLLTYQSSSPKPPSEVRAIQVEVALDRAKVRTRRAYLP